MTTAFTFVTSKVNIYFRDIKSGSFFEHEGNILIKTTLFCIEGKNGICIRVNSGTDIAIPLICDKLFTVYKRVTITLEV